MSLQRSSTDGAPRVALKQLSRSLRRASLHLDLKPFSLSRIRFIVEAIRGKHEVVLAANSPVTTDQARLVDDSVFF